MIADEMKNNAHQFDAELLPDLEEPDDTHTIKI